MTEAIPLVGDPTRVDLPIRRTHTAPENAVVARVDTGESLLLDAPHPRTEAPAEHRERGDVDVGIAVGVCVVLLELQVALVVQPPVQDGCRVPIRALDGRAEERGVVVGDEAVELECDVAEPRTVGLLKDLPLPRVPLPVARRGLSLTPVERGIEAGERLHDDTQRPALRVPGAWPIPDTLERLVRDVGGELRHRVRADVAAMGQDGREDDTDLVRRRIGLA